MRLFTLLYLISALIIPLSAQASSLQAAKDMIIPHKALYDIDLVSKKSGSQIINIHGQMFYQWKPTCDAWSTDHRFSLVYEYADSPGVHITSDFSTYETYDGKNFHYTARRKRDGELYEELRGSATMDEKTGKAVYSMPEGLEYDLPESGMFPMTHTLNMVNKIGDKNKFFKAVVFDGSDRDGPVEINTFIGKPVNAMAVIKPSEAIDMALINTPAWKARMAVFPVEQPEEAADYEMDLTFHQNGLISDMLIEYHDFSVTQKLVALEKLDDKGCEAEKSQKN